ncbi:MAG: tetratricopeptide repeat protein, partial [Rhodobacteraceae bacterium]|nr:tetratricopeptide repeat protein [Paracoccaceae bacterium]
MKADLEAELATAREDVKIQLSARIAELESQIANPEPALEVALKRIADLEALLERVGNDIGGDRIAEARAALERGDYSIADDLFAEIEVRRELEVQEAARAATGRGEIAEAEVRWADAAEHYTRAARLDPTYDTLIRAGKLLQQAGRYNDAIWHNEQLVKIAKQEFGAAHEKTATALNNLAISYRASARYDEAEPLYREALEIDRKTIGTDHSDYATRLNNLAGLLRATGRYGEAEPHLREALEIGR